MDFLLVFFLFPETQYRPPLSSTAANTTNDAESHSDKETTLVVIPRDGEPGEPLPPPKKSYFQELNPWSGLNPGSNDNPSFFFLVLRAWPLVVYPAVIYSFLVFSFTLACVLFVVNTAPIVFQSPPYNFSPGVQSLINLSAFIGAAFGAFAGGALTDLIVQWNTKRNNGIFEPESRLLALILPFFLVPAGVLMYCPLKCRLSLGMGLASRTSGIGPVHTSALV